MQISPLLAKAAKKAGIYVAEGNSLPGNMHLEAYGALKDLVRRLDAQPGLTFGETPVSCAVSGTILTIQPITPAEQAIIDGGGTVDLTDRITNDVPVISPRVFGTTELSVCSLGDLLARQDDSSFAFNVKEGAAYLVFYKAPGSITVLLRDRLIIDEDPFGDIHVPSNYEDYLVNTLAADLAALFQLNDSVGLLTSLAQKSIKGMSANNSLPKAPRQNLAKALAKYRR